MKQKIRRIFLLITSALIYYSGLWYLLFKTLRPKGLVVFNYHNFSTYCNDFFRTGSIYETNYAKNFERHLQFYKKYVNIKSKPIISKQDLDKLSLLITFDDGYKDNYDIAFPILRKNNIAAIFFITTNFIGESDLIWHDKFRYLAENDIVNEHKIRKILKGINSGNLDIDNIKFMINKINFPNIRILMNEKELKEISKCDNFILGSHTSNHLPLKKLNYNQKKKGIENSINFLSDKYEIEDKYFSYPNGLYDKETLNVLNDAKVKYAFTTESGINRDINNPYELKRIGINPSDPVFLVALKILKVII